MKTVYLGGWRAPLFCRLRGTLEVLIRNHVLRKVIKIRTALQSIDQLAVVLLDLARVVNFKL
jgi:hypothetical protein